MPGGLELRNGLGKIKGALVKSESIARDFGPEFAVAVPGLAPAPGRVRWNPDTAGAWSSSIP